MINSVYVMLVIVFHAVCEDLCVSVYIHVWVWVWAGRCVGVGVCIHACIPNRNTTT